MTQTVMLKLPLPLRSNNLVKIHQDSNMPLCRQLIHQFLVYSFMKGVSLYTNNAKTFLLLEEELLKSIKSCSKSFLLVWTPYSVVLTPQKRNEHLDGLRDYQHIYYRQPIAYGFLKRRPRKSAINTPIHRLRRTTAVSTRRNKVRNAVLKREKTSGPDGLYPALFKVGKESLVTHLTKTDAIWGKGKVPAEWGASTDIPRPTVVTFFKLKLVFDSVNRQTLWQCLWSKGVLHRLSTLLQILYAKSRGRVKVCGELSSEFVTLSSVRVVDNFVYLDSCIIPGGLAKVDISIPIGEVMAAFVSPHHLLRRRDINLPITDLPSVILVCSDLFFANRSPDFILHRILQLEVLSFIDEWWVLCQYVRFTMSAQRHQNATDMRDILAVPVLTGNHPLVRLNKVIAHKGEFRLRKFRIIYQRLTFDCDWLSNQVPLVDVLSCVLIGWIPPIPVVLAVSRR
ncbi:hypothetical protein CLF_100198 [Clonorchis sinensis]|uniref:Uncharacterized protein n=1 Tax=Clonorchis sinensis TaxID=79923 RepID=G7Y2W9_CLOSI|nr:hypothetical protein CLF_100198 [Clonorchis sinensis]